MSYYTSADDYKQFFELTGTEKPSDDYVNIPGDGGVVQPSISDSMDSNPMAPAPSTTTVEQFRFNRSTGKMEPFKFNKRTGKYEPYRNVRHH